MKPKRPGKNDVIAESNEKWPQAKIKEVAAASGKPLEVRCAQAFLSMGWMAYLGSYFDDQTLKPLRELDVLAVREEEFDSRNPIRLRVRTLVSCKGFPPNQSPLTYSASSNLSYKPQLLTFNRSSSGGVGPLRALENAGADILLDSIGIDHLSPLVAFSIISRTVLPLSRNLPDEFKLLGDRELFDGVDSAVKAALHWRQQDRQSNESFAAINVPICVFQIPFWNVSINDGVIGEPLICEKGFQVLSFPNSFGDPNQGASEHPLVIITAENQLNEVIHGLNELWNWFTNEMRMRLSPRRP